MSDLIAELKRFLRLKQLKYGPLKHRKENHMSFYSYLEGYIEFEKKEDFEKVAKAIIEGGWYDPEKNAMYYEGDEEVESEAYDLEGNEVDKLIDPDKLSIAIPCSNYRNLDRVFSEHLCCENIPKFKGEIKGDSDDGCNDVWVYRDGEYFSYDIVEYAKVRGMEVPEEDENDNSCYWDARHDVVEAFYKEPVPKANSQKFIEED